MRRAICHSLVAFTVVGLFFYPLPRAHAMQTGSSSTCRVTLRVPNDARIFVNGDRYSSQDGLAVRTYLFHPNQNGSLWYNVRAEVTRNGKREEEVVDIEITPGCRIDETFLAKYQSPSLPPSESGSPSAARSVPFSYSKRHDNSDGSVTFDYPSMLYRGISHAIVAIDYHGGRIIYEKDIADWVCRSAGYSRSTNWDKYVFERNAHVCGVSLVSGRLTVVHAARWAHRWNNEHMMWAFRHISCAP